MGTVGKRKPNHRQEPVRAGGVTERERERETRLGDGTVGRSMDVYGRCHVLDA
jgi:hypothetical protein